MTLRTQLAALLLAVLPLTLLAPPALSQPGDEPQPKWTKKFQSGLSIVNAESSLEGGVARDADDVRGAGILQAVDTVHPVMLAIEGDIKTGARLHGLDADTGTTLWSKTGLRLESWRPFQSYRVSPGGDAYAAIVIGDTAVLLVANGERAGGCTDGRELLAFALTDGRLLWCTSDVPNGELTFVPVPEQQLLLAWDRNATSGVRVTALNLLTGRARWTTTLPIASADEWLRFVSYFTSTGLLGRRPTLVSGRYLGLVLGQFRKVGGSWRRMTIMVIDLVSGQTQWQVEEDTRASRFIPPTIWWTLNERVVLVVVNRRMSAYDVMNGRKLWTAEVDSHAQYEFASNGSVHAAIVEPIYGYRDQGRTPILNAKGVGVVDLDSGETLWRYRNAGRVESNDLATSTVIVRNGKQILLLDALSGVPRQTIQSTLKGEVQSVRLVDDLVVVQSSDQLAAFDRRSGMNTYTQTIPLPNLTRGERVARMTLLAAGMAGFPALSWTWAGALTVTVYPVGGASFVYDRVSQRRLRRLRLGYPIFAPDFAYFATGAGNRRRIVAVSAKTGEKTTIGPYARRRLGNLINESHGIMHVIDDREIQSFEYGLDRERHDQVHMAADAAIVGETIERARAHVADGQTQKALSEAGTVIARLERKENMLRPLTAALAERQRSFAEAYEISAELAPYRCEAAFCRLTPRRKRAAFSRHQP
jgi:outer membrane protein assembly factor BamB